MHRLVVTAAIFAAAAMGQPADNPLSTATKGMFGLVRNYVTRAAEKMPEENYAFKPSDDVRTFGAIVGHVADANYMFCSAALVEASPAKGSAEQLKTKAELVAALKESFAYCEKAYNAMTDTSGAEKVKFVIGGTQPKLGILNFNCTHDYEHYGNMTTYMRIKGIVPPSSEAPPAKKK